jgi:tetratricopeptide (TPR) repeat protein
MSSSEAPTGLRPDQQLGPYQITSRIGAGGMGEVYRARDTRLGRDVAVKVLPSSFAQDPGRLRRFEQEARAAAALNHPNIVVLHDIGTEGGTPYLVQELLAGESLQQLLARGAGLPTRKAIQYAGQIAEGLDAAHRKSIVHRDLKPSNVFVTSEGHVKILDFGLAKLVDPPESRESIGEKPTAEMRTGEGVVLGTVGYMAPEQVRGQAVDHRADIFALGCVLYEMLSGQRAFVGDSAADVLSAILSRDPAPLSLATGEITPALDGIVRRCLEKRAEDRFSSAHDVALALELTSGPVSQPVLLRRRREWVRPLLVAGGVVAVLAGVLLGPRVWRGAPPPPAPLDPQRVAVAGFENRTGTPALDAVGQMAADAIRDGLAQIDWIKVVPGTLAARAAPRAGKDPVPALAEATGAGLVISGAYYRPESSTLQIRASLTDAIAGKPLYTVEPVTAPREQVAETVATLRGRIIDAVAAHSGIPWGNPRDDLLLVEVKPPPFEALKAWRDAWGLLGSDPPAAEALFTRALDIAPSFVSARMGLVVALNNQYQLPGKWPRAAAQLEIIERDQARLTPRVRLGVRLLRASLEGRLEEYRRLNLELSQGDALSINWSMASDNLQTNRPRQAAEVLENPALEQDLKEPIGVYLFLVLTGALHQLGEHEQELAEARRGVSFHPDLLNMRAYEARALVALGRLAETDALVDEVLAMAPHWALAKCCVPDGTPGYVMLSAAEELRAHGHREAAVKIAGRAAEWYRSRPGGEAEEEKNRTGLGESLYRTERWEEARAVFTQLATQHPENLNHLGRLGTLAARRGARAEVERIDRRLQKLHRLYYSPETNTFWRARARALLGDREAALALLRDAIAEGLGAYGEAYGYALIFHHSMDLEALRGDPAFEALLEPKE